MGQFNRTLEIATANQSAKGCLETFIDVLRGALRVNIVLRYQEDLPQEQRLSDKRLIELRLLHESVTRNLIGDKKGAFRIIMNQLSPCASNQPTASKQNSVPG